MLTSEIETRILFLAFSACVLCSSIQFDNVKILIFIKNYFSVSLCEQSLNRKLSTCNEEKTWKQQFSIIFAIYKRFLVVNLTLQQTIWQLLRGIISLVTVIWVTGIYVYTAIFSPSSKKPALRGITFMVDPISIFKNVLISDAFINNSWWHMQV